MGECSRCIELQRQLREAREEIEEWQNKDAAPKSDLSVQKLSAWLNAPWMNGRGAKILAILMDAHGECVSRPAIEDVVDYSGGSRNYVNVYVSHLRRALKKRGITQNIVTHWGHGYSLPASTSRWIRELISER